LNIFCHTTAKVHCGIIYGKINIELKYFLNFILVLVTKNAKKPPYKMDIYPYILDNTIEMQEMLFTQLEAIEAYHQDERIRALYSSERFCTLMMQYVVVLRK